MVTTPARRLLVKATTGHDALERCAQALTVASTASAAGVPVDLWLVGEAAWLAVPGRADGWELPHSPRPVELRDALLADVAGAGVSLTLCTQCAARRGITADDLLPAARVAGAASFVALAVAPGVQALVY